ncbi:IS1096 element passenger TnpR family protein [Methylotuvimicrobium alcaliphilum]|uniref:IS1096 element passenger TnpR family protein n=1 Tax=Methylotuvimicrobium alcaliphilum TaxID=271065 RepID=UPI003B5AC5F8
MSNKNQHLSPEDAQVIKNQVFSDTLPGTLLKDFQALLDFIGSDGIEVTKTTQHIGMKYLFELNERMTRPVETELKRPQQKAFPNLHGLYLLLRVSGLARLVKDKNKTLLKLDPDVLASWQQLNAVERYFSLLFCWIVRGDEEILGESRSWNNQSFRRCLEVYQSTKPSGSKEHGSRGYMMALYFVSLHNVALMALFGFLIRTKFNPGGSLEGVELSDFGRALLAYFDTATELYMDENDYELSDGFYDFCAKDLMPLFPDWQNRLLIKEREVLTEGYSVIAVKVRDAVRKLAVPHDAVLHDFAMSILDAFNFDDDHLYEFVYKNELGLIERVTERVAHSFADDGDYWADDMTLGEMPIHEGMTFVFHYDFGDDWRFECQIESLIKEAGKYTEPKVIEKKGRAPKQYYY